MITEWIIQPQIDKLEAQKIQLDILRVDMKVQSFLIKQELRESRQKRICFALKCSAEAFKNFGQLLAEAGKNFERIKSFEYPSGGYHVTGVNTRPGLQEGIYNEFIYTPKKNINGNN